jgi:uncharacterized metal-binding protein
MNFKAHASAGIIAATTQAIILYINHVDIETISFSFAIVFIFSLLPDLDTHSTPSRFSAIFILLYSVYLIYYNSILEALTINMLYVFFKTLKHRGITHKYILPALAIVIGVYLSHLMYISIGIGLIVHYACDSISPFKLKNWI